MTPVVLSTPRLRLRPLTVTDAPALAAYRGDPAVAAFQGWTLPYPPEQAHALVEAMAGKHLGDSGWVQYAVALPDASLVGDVALRTHGAQAELGVTLAPAAHGHGYATEAVTALITHAFGTLGLHRLHASIDPRNTPVARLLFRLGFRHEGTLIEAYEHRGEWTDDALYGLLRREWPEAPRP